MTNEKSGLGEFQHDDSVVDEILELARRALEAALNLRWDTAKEYNHLALARAEKFQGEGPEQLLTAVKGITAMTKGLVIQLRDVDLERYNRAITLFKDAQDHVRELLLEFPDNADFKNTLTSLGVQILWAERCMAIERNNRKQALIQEAQIKSVINGVPVEHRHGYEVTLVLLRYANVMSALKEAGPALAAMDVERALHVALKVRDETSTTTSFLRVLGEGALFQGAEKIFIGGDEIVEATLAYVQALHAAIVDNVTRKEVDRLRRAEALYASGSDKIAHGTMILRKDFDEEQAKKLRTRFDLHIGQAHNLRILCQDTLKPKRWIASASVKFVSVFLLTVVVLIAVKTATNMGAGLGGGVLVAYMLLVSFVVALIGGFGFEALRFLPYGNLLAKSIPVVTKPASGNN